MKLDIKTQISSKKYKGLLNNREVEIYINKENYKIKWNRTKIVIMKQENNKYIFKNWWGLKGEENYHKYLYEYYDKDNIQINNCQGLDLLTNMKDKSVDLILTDPPYITSRDSGMNKHYDNIVSMNGNLKSEEEWEKYKQEHNYNDDKYKQNYMKYGTPYGKIYAVQTDYGKWDLEFTMETLEQFIKLYYQKLRIGGTLIIFFDLWKITPLKDILEKYKFKQLRMIEWIKTNPQPLNSKINYLTSCREIALVAVKGGKPTFHSSMDNGIYRYPLQRSKYKKGEKHPTMKSERLFEDILLKHSNENDLVVDTFLGSGTTGIVCKKHNRRFIGSEISKKYYEMCIERVII